ncbi:class III poly(R)-hydroxyalkanoic acid synthase subunit PhaC [Cycloclasticus pugetii]|uniref:class III poly(R)-hydroxyalkanoic acid synthase subunit PhaC n=1 Tax=Cycloclasticus pugetii TaxID=34068 RepID=UPI0009222EBF|nr:class III poly(R)-hydroxyalkanoic acid synthase subunit PhaC [Cycloclasticus pugetii]SHI45756.1 polyhydroxyalkanoate synthase [Cycloclasticus pugetii]|tara:strand:+ start:101 stop:1147 length:1047 start_codon:yes stop_codon:yes gene_type:complete
MPNKTKDHENIWQDEFVLLMEKLADKDKQPPPEVGSSLKELIYSENKLQLFHYIPLDVAQKKLPILITYALVNRPYIMDLEPKRSLILRLLEKGYPVYLIDWGYPDSSDRFTDLNDYINGYLHRCVQQVKHHSKEEKIDLLGVCQGGVFSLCYTALHPTEIRKLVTLVTPIDFHTKNNPLTSWTSHLNTQALASHTGNVPAELISQLFKAIKPFQLNREKYRRLKHIINNAESLNTFLRMERWLHDGPDLNRAAADEFLINFYQQNKLHENTLTIAGHAVLLNKITSPVLNLYATQDHLVPPEATRALKQHIKPELYQEQALVGGHIGAFTSPRTQQTLIQSLEQGLA